MFRTTRAAYKPFSYAFCFDYYEQQSKLHWLPTEVSLQNDVVQWRTKVSETEKHILTQVQLYLANADTDVAGVYVKKYLPNLPLPEVQQMLLTFGSIEAIHMHSYSYTLDTLGMHESAYSAFLDIDEMREKHEWLTQERTEGLSDVQKFLLDLAIGSAFGEGVQLFSAFAILISFQRRGVMNGLGTLTGFIARDEDLHCEAMCQVFNTIKLEHADQWTDDIRNKIHDHAVRAVELEDHFVDLVFKMGDLENITADEVKKYVRYVCNKRLQTLGLKPLWNVSENPFPWMDEILHGNEHSNFFEVRPTSYSKSNFSGTWFEAWTKFDDKRKQAGETFFQSACNAVKKLFSKE